MGGGASVPQVADCAEAVVVVSAEGLRNADMIGKFRSVTLMAWRILDLEGTDGTRRREGGKEGRKEGRKERKKERKKEGLHSRIRGPTRRM